ncbi:MAG: biotin/lipoyl-containing protein [Candidatus Latescibacterota bacterium]
MKVKMKMPDLSANEDQVRVVRWLVEPGQPLKRGQALLEVETDKAVVEVEAITSGTLQETCVAAEEEVTVGAVIAVIETGAGP